MTLALQEFTRNLIDYAGLFPPAKLDMGTVVKNYSEYLAGENGGRLARLIIPAARLGEFESIAANYLPTKISQSPWRISALVPANEEGSTDFGFAISGISQFNARHQKAVNGLAVVDVIEIKTPTAMHIERTINDLPVNLKAFMEIPHADDPMDLIGLLQKGDRQRFFAKIRTGGVTPELIPTTAEVARFIFACAENLVGLKATAGLHHPLRDEFNLTYEADSPRGTMHGFVNVFSAICFAFVHSLSIKEIESILNETRSTMFDFSRDGLTWNNLTISTRKLAGIRDNFAISFGSCSFTEPTTELVDVGIEPEPKIKSSV